MFIDLLPDFFRNSPEMVDLQNAIYKAYSDFAAAVEDLEKQLYIDTATWGLQHWEVFLGLPVAYEKDITERREAVKSRLRGYGTATKAMIQNVANSFGNGEVDVSENSADYTITIEFVSSLGIPSNIDDLKAALNLVMPAHLVVEYKYKYRRWSEFEHLLWGDLESLTWAQAKELEEI